MESTQVLSAVVLSSVASVSPSWTNAGALPLSAAQSNLGTSRLKAALANGAWEGKRNDEKHEE